MMYNDADEHWGHRFNILYDSGGVALGIAYNNENLILVEDFGYSAPGFSEIPSTKTCW